MIYFFTKIPHLSNSFLNNFYAIQTDDLRVLTPKRRMRQQHIATRLSVW